MHGIKVPLQVFAVKMKGGGEAYATMGGGVFAGHYGINFISWMVEEMEKHSNLIRE